MKELLRHTLAATAYRFQKAVCQADADFGSLNIGEGVRTPIEIINHMTNVIEFAIAIISGNERNKVEPGDLSTEVQTFTAKLKELDAWINKLNLSLAGAQKVMQGPVTDVITHVGQLAMMRRLHGQSIEKENYAIAQVEVGQFEYFS